MGAQDVQQPVPVFYPRLAGPHPGPPRQVKIIRWFVLPTEVVTELQHQTSFFLLVLLLNSNRGRFRCAFRSLPAAGTDYTKRHHRESADQRPT